MAPKCYKAQQLLNVRGSACGKKQHEILAHFQSQSCRKRSLAGRSTIYRGLEGSPGLASVNAKEFKEDQKGLKL